MELQNSSRMEVWTNKLAALNLEDANILLGDPSRAKKELADLQEEVEQFEQEQPSGKF